MSGFHWKVSIPELKIWIIGFCSEKLCYWLVLLIGYWLLGWSGNLPAFILAQVISVLVWNGASGASAAQHSSEYVRNTFTFNKKGPGRLPSWVWRRSGWEKSLIPEEGLDFNKTLCGHIWEPWYPQYLLYHWYPRYLQHHWYPWYSWFPLFIGIPNIFCIPDIFVISDGLSAL